MVKAALLKAGAMQRNRYDEVRILACQEVAHSLQSQECQWVSQMCFLIVFEGVNQLAYGAFIEEVCPGGIKMRWVAQARAAAVITPCPNKGDSADRAERRRNERQEILAGLTDMERAGIRDKGTADVTNRRQDDVKQRM